MEWRDLPPGHAIRQAAAVGGGRCHAFVMGKRRGQRWYDRGGTKLQHFAANQGGRGAMPVTGLTIHDIVISPRFPKPYFFSKAF
jgi:hypothetical protein